MYYTYVLKKNGKYYIGSTSDLQRRFREHQKDASSCKLMYFEAYLFKRNAFTREQKLKHYGSAWRALKQRIEA